MNVSHHGAALEPAYDFDGAGPRGSTLLELVQAIQRQVATDADVVTVVRWLVNTGAVVLTGTFAGQRI